MKLLLLETFSFPATLNRVYLTNDEKINIAKKMQRFNTITYYKVCQNMIFFDNEEYAVVQVWGKFD